MARQRSLFSKSSFSKSDAPKNLKKSVRIGPTEDQLQIQVMTYIRTQYPNVLAFHVPNGGSRNIIEATKLKRMGVLSGVPDILIFKPGPSKQEDKIMSYGFFIELKVGKNKPTENQLAIHRKLEKCALWEGTVCWTFDEAKKAIDDYLK